MSDFWIVMAFAGWGMGIWMLAFHHGWKKGFANAASTPMLEDAGKKKEGFKVEF